MSWRSVEAKFTHLPVRERNMFSAGPGRLLRGRQVDNERPARALHDSTVGRIDRCRNNQRPVVGVNGQVGHLSPSKSQP